MRSYEECFGNNLQSMRNERGLSQRELGGLIGFSDKAISKWERGGGIPDISVLYKMTEIFGVRLDDFFAEDRIYYLGIDGGGTKTMMVLADENMNVIRQERSDGCNPIDIGIEETKRRLRLAISEICRGIPMNKIAVFAGIAGGISSGNKPLLSAFFKEFGFLSYENDSDNKNIIAAGLGRSNGVSLIMGTGICAFRQKDGVCKQFSGWGYHFDNGGSGYNIGRDGLSAHFESLHGLGGNTLISDIIKASCPDASVLLGELYTGGKKEIASYSRAVYDAARQGDAIAISILEKNMKFAAKVIETAAESLDEEIVRVVVTGGLTADADTLKYLRAALSKPEHYDIQILSVMPAEGALMLAKEQADLLYKKG